MHTKPAGQLTNGYTVVHLQQPQPTPNAEATRAEATRTSAPVVTRKQSRALRRLQRRGRVVFARSTHNVGVIKNTSFT
jgi:hypothetical protein